MGKACQPLGHTCLHNSWFSSDVTKIQTPKSQEPLRFYLHLAKDCLKINFCESFQRDSVFRFKNIALPNFPSLLCVTLIWRQRRPSLMLKNNLSNDIMPFEW